MLQGTLEVDVIFIQSLLEEFDAMEYESYLLKPEMLQGFGAFPFIIGLVANGGFTRKVSKFQKPLESKLHNLLGK